MVSVLGYVILGILVASSLSAIILMLLKMLNKRRIRNDGRQIEESIDKKNPSQILLKKAISFGREEEFQHSVIYLFQIFRLLCETEFTIRNAKTIESDKLIMFLRGTKFSQIKLRSMNEIYKKARYDNQIPTTEEYNKMKTFIELLLNEYNL